MALGRRSELCHTTLILLSLVKKKHFSTAGTFHQPLEHSLESVLTSIGFQSFWTMEMSPVHPPLNLSQRQPVQSLQASFHWRLNQQYHPIQVRQRLYRPNKPCAMLHNKVKTLRIIKTLNYLLTIDDTYFLNLILLRWSLWASKWSWSWSKECYDSTNAQQRVSLVNVPLLW